MSTMQNQAVEMIGYIGAAASLYGCYARTMIPLRIAAIASCTLFLAYAALKGNIPPLVINAILLPLNIQRLHSMTELIRKVDVAAQGDLNYDWIKPYLQERLFKAGEVLFTPADSATEAFYIVTGEVELVEISKTVGPDTLIGEMGLFSQSNMRTMTARCKTDVEAGVITYDEFKQLYFQNPQFGFYLTRLIMARAQDNMEFHKRAQAG